MPSYEIRTSNHDSNNIIARFPGVGMITFIFNPVSHEITYEGFEASDTQETGSAERVLGVNRLSNAREAAILHYNIEHATPLSSEVHPFGKPSSSGTQIDLFN